MCGLHFCFGCTEELARDLAGDLGKSECYIKLEGDLDTLDKTYEEEMYDKNIDDDGNRQSLETCNRSKELTDIYLIKLREFEEYLNDNNSCADDEVLLLEARVEGRIRDLEEDLVNVWSRCEDIYN